MVVSGGARSVKGGRSARYDERRASRGSEVSQAPPWTDGAAKTLLDQLHKDADKAEVYMSDHCLHVLCSEEKMRETLYRCRTSLSERDKSVALGVMIAHGERVKAALEAEGKAGAKKKVHSFLKPLREKAALAGRATGHPIEVCAVDGLTAAVSDWFHPDPEGLRVRPIAPSQRIVDGLKKWPLGWVDTVGVVCYERSAGRVRAERPDCGGAPDEAAHLVSVVPRRIH